MNKEQKKDSACAVFAGISVVVGLMTSGTVSAISFGLAVIAFTLTQMIIEEG